MVERRVGFTGTRLGMSEEQLTVVESLIRNYDWLHHGDCFGADAEAHLIAVRLGLQTKAHPPRCSTLRAFCRADVTADPKPYLVRDRDIVDETAALIATPAHRKQTGGTWATISFARAAGKPVTIVFPDGTAQHDPG